MFQEDLKEDYIHHLRHPFRHHPMKRKLHDTQDVNTCRKLHRCRAAPVHDPKRYHYDNSAFPSSLFPYYIRIVLFLFANSYGILPLFPEKWRLLFSLIHISNHLPIHN